MVPSSAQTCLSWNEAKVEAKLVYYELFWTNTFWSGGDKKLDKVQNVAVTIYLTDTHHGTAVKIATVLKYVLKKGLKKC